MKKPTDPEAVRRARLRQLFTARHSEKATEDGVVLSVDGFNSITLIVDTICVATMGMRIAHIGPCPRAMHREKQPGYALGVTPPNMIRVFAAQRGERDG